jgi:hypothetical protein
VTFPESVGEVFGVTVADGLAEAVGVGVAVGLVVTAGFGVCFWDELKKRLPKKIAKAIRRINSPT